MVRWPDIQKHSELGGVNDSRVNACSAGHKAVRPKHTAGDSAAFSIGSKVRNEGDEQRWGQLWGPTAA